MKPKETIRSALSKALGAAGISIESSAITLEHPGELAHGDYATNVVLKVFGPLSHGNFNSAFEKNASQTVWRHDLDKFKNPRALAEKIVVLLGEIKCVSKIEIAGPGFINFTLTPQALALMTEEACTADMWGSNQVRSNETIMVEYTDPNPFKEFHIGHLMSNAIGESISRLLQFSGAKVLRANYQGDVGPHVAKALYILRERNITDPTIEDIGMAYVEGSNRYETDLETKFAIDALNKMIYDRNNPQINALYKKGREVSLAHFEGLYKILGTKFDFYFFESETAPIGISIVREHPEVFEESEGAIVFKGEKYGLHTRVFINKLGLPTYEAKDLGLAKLKTEKAQFDRSITITASEQAEYFKVVKKAMELVMPEIGKKVIHITHGMMRFAEGKMSSRKGNVITGESLIKEMKDKSEERSIDAHKQKPNVSQSYSHEVRDVARREQYVGFIMSTIYKVENALKSIGRKKDILKIDNIFEQVSIGAIKYSILKQRSGQDIIFNPEKSLSLEGDSGPYLQYAYARSSAILEKAKRENVEPKLDENAEPNEIVRLLYRFPEVVEYAASELEPHLVTNFLLEIASAFNSWYAQVQIIDGTAAAPHKVAIVEAINRTLKNGLWLLGIPAPERM